MTQIKYPYFGDHLASLLGPINHHRYFKSAWERAKPLAGRGNILEVGSWAGASLVAWSEVAPDVLLTNVDTWLPYHKQQGPLYERMTRACKDHEIFNHFLENMRAYDLMGRVTSWRMTSAEYLNRCIAEKRLYNLVYIDGDKTYEFVDHDIRLAKTVVDEGGVLCGYGLEQQLPEVEKKSWADNWRELDTMDGFHPGVTRAVWETFREVSAQDGFWAVQKRNGAWYNVDLKQSDMRLVEQAIAKPETKRRAKR